MVSVLKISNSYQNLLTCTDRQLLHCLAFRYLLDFRFHQPVAFKAPVSMKASPEKCVEYLDVSFLADQRG